MAKIERSTQKIFAVDAPERQITVFRTTGTDIPVTSKDPAQLQGTYYQAGWLNADNTGNILPYAEDMNALHYIETYNIAYLLQQGIPEYSDNQKYYEGSICYYSGGIYKCILEPDIGRSPLNTLYWEQVSGINNGENIGSSGVGVFKDAVNGKLQFKKLSFSNSFIATEYSDVISIDSSATFKADTISAKPDLSRGMWLTWNVDDANKEIYLGRANSTGTSTSAPSFKVIPNRIVPNTNNSGSLGAYGNQFYDTWTHNVLSDVSISFCPKMTASADSRYASFIVGSYYTDSGIVDDQQYCTFRSNVAPSSTNSFSLGTSIRKWKEAYINNVYYGNLTASSDERLKKDIEPLNGCLEAVEALNFVKYKWDDSKPESPADANIHYGLIAQEVAKVAPELVNIPDSEDEIYTLRFENVVYTMAKALQELSEKVKELEAKIKE